jgi:hypothetical protein
VFSPNIIDPSGSVFSKATVHVKPNCNESLPMTNTQLIDQQSEVGRSCRIQEELTTERVLEEAECSSCDQLLQNSGLLPCSFPDHENFSLLFGCTSGVFNAHRSLQSVSLRRTTQTHGHAWPDCAAQADTVMGMHLKQRVNPLAGSASVRTSHTYGMYPGPTSLTILIRSPAGRSAPPPASRTHGHSLQLRQAYPKCSRA